MTSYRCFIKLNVMNMMHKNSMPFQQRPLYYIDKCNIDFFNFRHRQVRNFKIFNHFKRDQNFVVNF